MSKQRPIHQFTEFDLTCEEKNEYDKTYGSDLSYGYYSAYKATNKLPKEWYEYLEEVKKISKKDSKLDRLEYQEYLRKTHKKTNFPKYSEGRSAGVFTSTGRFLKASSTTLNLSFEAIFQFYFTLFAQKYFIENPTKRQYKNKNDDDTKSTNYHFFHAKVRKNNGFSVKCSKKSTSFSQSRYFCVYLHLRIKNHIIISP